MMSTPAFRYNIAAKLESLARYRVVVVTSPGGELPQGWLTELTSTVRLINNNSGAVKVATLDSDSILSTPTNVLHSRLFQNETKIFVAKSPSSSLWTKLSGWADSFMAGHSTNFLVWVHDPSAGFCVNTWRLSKSFVPSFTYRGTGASDQGGPLKALERLSRTKPRGSARFEDVLESAVDQHGEAKLSEHALQATICLSGSIRQVSDACDARSFWDATTRGKSSLLETRALAELASQELPVRHGTCLPSCQAQAKSSACLQKKFRANSLNLRLVKCQPGFFSLVSAQLVEQVGFAVQSRRQVIDTDGLDAQHKKLASLANQQLASSFMRFSLPQPEQERAAVAAFF